jgi:gluconokinase
VNVRYKALRRRALWFLHQQIALQAAQGPYSAHRINPASNAPRHIIVMGVSGCGKSTLASAIAAYLGWQMVEGIAFHPAHNVAKMSAGQPLTDADRQPWLAQLNQELRQRSHVVLSCSALKARYRRALSDGLAVKPLFVHVQASYEQLLERMQARQGHFMPAQLLRSQFEALEIPNEAGIACLTVSALDSTASQVSQLVRFLDR